MKIKQTLLLWALLFLIASSCNRHPLPYSLVLEQADSLSASEPERAILLLDSLYSTLSQADSSSRMYCQLLRIKARDRAYIRHTNDYEILEVIDYYERHPKGDLLAWAYCYGGRVYRDMDDTPRALSYLQKSLAELEKAQNTNLRQRVLSQVAYLFYYQSLFPESRAVRYQIIQADSLQGNYDRMVTSYTDMARCFIAEQEFDSASLCAQHASYLVRQHQLTRQQSAIDLLNAQVLDYQGKHSKALSLITPYLNDSTLADATPYLAVAARALMASNNYTEAEPICLRIMQSSKARLQTKADAAHHLALIEEHKGRNAQALDYHHQTVSIFDSLLKANRSEKVTLVSSFYQNAERERHMKELEEQKSRAEGRFFFMLLLSALLLLAITIGWIQHKRRQAEALLWQEQALTRFKSSSLCQRLYTLHYAQQPIPRGLWEEIEEYVNEIFPRFIPKLNTLATFTETEYHLSILTRLDFRNIEIATLLGRHKSAISLAKKRLYVKVRDKEGKAEDWDHLIKSL